MSRSYRRSSDFVVREVGDRRVLVPVRAAIPHDVLMFLLDGPVASRLWELLAEPRTTDQLVAAVLEEFEAEQLAVEEEVGAFLRQLEGLGAVGAPDAP